MIPRQFVATYSFESFVLSLLLDNTTRLPSTKRFLVAPELELLNGSSAKTNDAPAIARARRPDRIFALRRGESVPVSTLAFARDARELRPPQFRGSPGAARSRRARASARLASALGCARAPSCRLVDRRARSRPLVRRASGSAWPTAVARVFPGNRSDRDARSDSQRAPRLSYRDRARKIRRFASEYKIAGRRAYVSFVASDLSRVSRFRRTDVSRRRSECPRVPFLPPAPPPSRFRATVSARANIRWCAVRRESRFSGFCVTW